MLELTIKQFKAVKGLVVENCANCSDGKCIIIGMKCLQLNCKTNLCSYFKKFVLPIDQHLYSEIVKGGETYTKRCEKCNSIFFSKSKNTRFCKECAMEQRKVTFRNSKRRIRTHMSTK